MSRIRAIFGTLGGIVAVLAGTAIAVGVAWYVIDNASGKDDGLPEHWQRGMNVTAFLPDAYAKPTARRAMVTARSTGTRRVALVPTWYMANSASNDVVSNPQKTPTDASIETAAGYARSLGLSVVIKPHVDVLDGTFRGDIMPADSKAWFASYEAMIMRYAELAQRIDADAFVIGTELTSMSLFPDDWRALIAKVRAAYDGTVTYAANWVDGAESVEFWDDLDLIGIDAYMPLQTSSPDPSVDELVTAWGPYESRMASLTERWGKPIVFTELGYQSRAGSAAQLGQADAPADQQAQANAYEAAFQALSDQPDFNGIWWWDWSAEGIEDPVGWSAEGKLAEQVLSEWQGPPAPRPHSP